MSKISFSATSDNVNESLELASQTVKNTYQRQSVYTRYDVSGIKRVLDLGVGLNYTRTDYSKFFIRDAGTNIVPLTANNELVNELSMDLSMLYTHKAWEYTLSTSQPVDVKYFKQQLYQAGIHRGYYRKSTVLSLLYQHLDRSRPLTYFRDPESFVVKPQVTKIVTDTIVFNWEQLISSRAKMKNGLSYSKENEERPSNYSVFTKFAFSITPLLFYKVNYRYTKELTSDALKNDRGYFTNHLFSNEMSWEFIYDWTLSASYSLAREDEYDTRNLARRRTGIDQYGLSLDHVYSNTLLSLSLGKMESNTGIVSTQVTLGASWNF